MDFKPTLAERIAELKRLRYGAVSDVDYARYAITHAVDIVEKLEADRDALLAALKRHGQHSLSCGERVDMDCDCGLKSAINGR